MAIRKYLIALLCLISFNGYSQSYKDLTIRNSLKFKDSLVTGMYTGILPNTTYVDRSIKDSIAKYTFFSAGTSGQVPYMNPAGSDFLFSSNFLFNGKTFIVQYSTENTLIGFDAGNSITTGATYNTSIGANSGKSISTGDYNTFIGASSGRNNNNNYNTFIGYNSGYSNANANNTFVGSGSGYNNTGSNNTIIGLDAGRSSSTSSGNIFLGYNSGYNETGSNKLYIENSNSSSPLIYGEFDNNKLIFNTDSTISTGYLKADSGSFQVHTGVFSRYAAYDTQSADTWVTIKYDTTYQNVSTSGFKFNDDSTGIVCNFNGIVQFGGHVSFYNNSAGLINAGIYMRLLINSTEQSSFNTAKYRTFAANTYDDIVSLVAPISIQTNDTIYVQGRVTDTDIDVQGGDGVVFDSSRAFSISLTQILKKP